MIGIVSCNSPADTRGQAVVPFASVCHIEWVENAVTHPLWKVSLVRAATSEGDRHTSISISVQLGVLLPRHLGSCWKGKHDTVCMYVCTKPWRLVTPTVGLQRWRMKTRK